MLNVIRAALRGGRVTTQQATGQGKMSLEGTASDRTSAVLDIDRGLLVSATSTWGPS